MSAVTVFVAALATAVATGLGALPFLAVRRPLHSWLGRANALAAGFMTGASIGLLYEGARFGPGRTVGGALAGAAFIALVARRVGPGKEAHFGAMRGADARRALLIVGVMTVHSFTEGVGVGVAFGGEQALGILIAVVPAFLLVETFAPFLPVGLGFAAGAMLWLVASDSSPRPCDLL